MNVRFHSACWLFLLVLSGCRSQNGVLGLEHDDLPPGATPNRTAFYRFGAVKMGTVVHKKIVVHNLGKNAITLASLEPSVGDSVHIGTGNEAAVFSVDFEPGRIIPPGGQTEFQISFSPPSADAPAIEHE